MSPLATVETAAKKKHAAMTQTWITSTSVVDDGKDRHVSKCTAHKHRHVHDQARTVLLVLEGVVVVAIIREAVDAYADLNATAVPIAA